MEPEPSWDQLSCQKLMSQGHPAADPSLPVATKTRAGAQREKLSSLGPKI